MSRYQKNKDFAACSAGFTTVRSADALAETGDCGWTEATLLLLDLVSRGALSSGRLAKGTKDVGEGGESSLVLQAMRVESGNIFLLTQPLQGFVISAGSAQCQTALQYLQFLQRKGPLNILFPVQVVVKHSRGTPNPSLGVGWTEKAANASMYRLYLEEKFPVAYDGSPDCGANRARGTYGSGGA